MPCEGLSPGVDDVLQVSARGATIVATLNRPAVHNAMSAELVDRLADLVEQLAADGAGGRRCLVVTGAGHSFCSGIDVKESAWSDPPARAARRDSFRRLIRGLHEIPIPTVAAVEGHALGGGLELAMACDIVICGDTADFGLPELGVGAIPGGGGVHALGERAGRGVVASMLLGGRRVTASRLFALGGVDQVVPTGQSVETAVSMAASRFETVDRDVLRGSVRLLRDSTSMARLPALEMENEHWQAAADTRS